MRKGVWGEKKVVGCEVREMKRVGNIVYKVVRRPKASNTRSDA